MTLFADILLAIIAIASPTDGTTVPTLREAQKDYLSRSREERFALMEDAAARKRLAASGATQEPLRLAWRGPSNAVYRLEIARDGGDRQVFSVTNRTEVRISNLELGAKYGWCVTGPGGETAKATFLTEAQPPRLLRAGGVRNLRDAGGWSGLGGRKVRQGMVYRSAGLRLSAQRKGSSLIGGAVEPGANRVTADGIRTLRDDLKVRTDVELRNRQEAACMFSSVLGDDVKWVHVPFVAYDFIGNLPRGREPFAKLFETFLDKKNYPILVHCSGGRDRTGTLVFLLNGLLGVSDDDLCRDWEATVFHEHDVKFGHDRLERLLDYLKTFGGKTMAERCERYALGCGITRAEIETFRRILLEGAD